MNVKIKEVVSYGGHSLKSSGAVLFTLKAGYDQLTETIKLMQLLNNDVNIKAKLPNKKPIKLGSFRIKQIQIDGDGESVLKFDGVNDYIEMDNLNTLPLASDDDKIFTVMFESEIEVEDDEDGEQIPLF